MAYEHEFAILGAPCNMSFWMDSRITRLTMDSIPIFNIDHCKDHHSTLLEIRCARVKLAAIYGVLPAPGSLDNSIEGPAAAATVDDILGQLLYILNAYPEATIRMTLAVRHARGKAEL